MSKTGGFLSWKTLCEFVMFHSYRFFTKISSDTSILPDKQQQQVAITITVGEASMAMTVYEVI
jgi:serine protease inhibitor ecotin